MQEYDFAAEVECDKFVYEAFDAAGQPVPFLKLTKITEPHTLQVDVITADEAHVGLHQVTIIGRMLQNPGLSFSQTIVVEIKACQPTGLLQGNVPAVIEYTVTNPTIEIDLKDMFKVNPLSCPWELDFTFSPSLTSPDPFTVNQEVGKLFVYTDDESKVNSYVIDVTATLRNVLPDVSQQVSITINVRSACYKANFKATSEIRSMLANVKGAAETMDVYFDDPMPSCGARQIDVTFDPPSYAPLAY